VKRVGRRLLEAELEVPGFRRLVLGMDEQNAHAASEQLSLPLFESRFG
jgi:hypothetical protein